MTMPCFYCGGSGIIEVEAHEGLVSCPQCNEGGLKNSFTNDSADVLNHFIAQQGWNEHSVKSLLTQFIEQNNLTQQLYDFLKKQTNEENQDQEIDLLHEYIELIDRQNDDQDENWDDQEKHPNMGD